MDNKLTAIIDSLNYTKLNLTDQRYNETGLINSLNWTKLNVTDQRYNESLLINSLNWTKLNITDQRFNETALIDSLNSTKAKAGTCNGVEVLQNVTSTGVQCVNVSSGGKGYKEYIAYFSVYQDGETGNVMVYSPYTVIYLDEINISIVDGIGLDRFQLTSDGMFTVADFVPLGGVSGSLDLNGLFKWSTVRLDDNTIEVHIEGPNDTWYVIRLLVMD
jgi:hypothetical protein